MIFTKERRWLPVAVILLTLLGYLAVLQYRGLASISDAERGRLHASAQKQAADFSAEFDKEISRAVFTFYSLSLQPQGDPAAGAARNFARWRATAQHPRLLRDIFILSVAQPSPELRRVLPDGTAVPAEWPAEFAAWIPKLKTNASLQHPGGTRGFLLPDVPAFFLPLMGVNMVDTPKVTGSFTFTGLLFGWLDRAYIEHELLPALVKRYFAARDGFDYNVAVVSPKEKNRIVFVSDPHLTASAFSTPDVQATIFQVRLDQLLQAVAGASGASAASLGIRSDPDAGEWQVRLVHRSGSLAQAVGVVRRRNLAISLAGFLLVAASVGFLLISSRRAERLARQQVVFVAGVSHDLRTPLTVIRSAAENLSDGLVADPDQVKRYGALIATEGRRLTEMVEQVMAYAGFEAGRDLSQRTTIEVEALIEEAVTHSRIEDGGCTLERAMAADVPKVCVNRPALCQAIANLLSNAAKYGGADRWVRIAAERSPDGRQVRIVVSDHGEGVRPDEQRRIFEPFFRGREVAGSTVRGTGLGLSLARRIAEAHGGSISVRSVRGHGSAFTLQLPAEVAAQAVRTTEAAGG